MERKLVVLGIPWDIDTDGLREYMSKFGDLEDCIVMRERSSGRSRGFGYVTFESDEDAKAALSGEHFLGNRMLEVKVATPKEEMRTSSKKITRIFVARIPQSVTKNTFQSHFEKYGEITDLYMPKDQGSTAHRGIGFITFAKSESVDNLMAETHELGGTTIVVDRATPKEEEFKPSPRPQQGGYGAYNAYISAATRYAALGAPTMYDHPPAMFGRSGGESSRGAGKKIFVGRLPQETTIDDLRQYFGRFGRIKDVYVPRVCETGQAYFPRFKSVGDNVLLFESLGVLLPNIKVQGKVHQLGKFRDPKRSGHRGFGFVTFAEEGVADRVARRSHEILGQRVAIDTATPLDDPGTNAGPPVSNMEMPFPSFGGPMRTTYGRMYGSLDFDDWGYGISGGRPSRTEWRYRPY